MKAYNLSKVDMANVGAGAGIKDCGRDKISGILNGFGVMKAKSVDEETGEIEEKEVAIVKVDGIVYSGTSKVMVGRLEAIESILDSEEDLKTGKLKVHFDTVKCKAGDGVTLILDEYAY